MRNYKPCRVCGNFHTNPASSSICSGCGLTEYLKNLELKQEIQKVEEAYEVDPCVVSLQIQLDAANNKIAELEKYIQKMQADRINDIAKERKRWAREDLAALAIRDLEQQAKGVEDAFNESSRILKSKKYAKKAYLGIIDLTAELYEYGDNLRNQAKALKEGE